MEFWKKQGGDKKHSFHSYIESDFKKKSYTCILIILDLRLCSQFILLIYYSASVDCSRKHNSYKRKVLIDV